MPVTKELAMAEETTVPPAGGGQLDVSKLSPGAAEDVMRLREKIPNPATDEAPPPIEDATPPEPDKPPVVIDAQTATLQALQVRVLRIEEQAATCSERKARWDARKEEAADAKKDYDSAVERLLEMIEEAEKPLPLFDNQAGPTVGTPDAPSVSEALASDSASTVRLDSLADPAIPPGVLGKLAQSGMETIEQFARHDWTHKVVKGIGPAMLDKIQAAMDAHFAREKKLKDALAPTAETPKAEEPPAVTEIHEEAATQEPAPVAQE
jgi:hypothetical protein